MGGGVSGGYNCQSFNSSHDIITSHSSPTGYSFLPHKKSKLSSRFINHHFLSSLASYCPHIVLTLLSHKPLLEPRSHRLTGACLLADICGFTKFSGDLCKEGVSGIDKLRRVTSSFLTKFIETIYFSYGDVIAFAGDALICYFGPLPEEKERLVVFLVVHQLQLLSLVPWKR
jgi:hypothetical protein